MLRGENTPVQSVEAGRLSSIDSYIAYVAGDNKLRWLTKSIGTVLSTGLVVAGLAAAESKTEEEVSLTSAEIAVDATVGAPPDDKKDLLLTTTTTLPPTTTTEAATTTTLPPTTTTATVPPPPVVSAPAKAEVKVDARVEKAIDAIELTPQGYQDFMDSISFEHYDFAQSFPEFDPRRNGIPQNPADTKYVTWHFTVTLSEIRPVITEVATRGDEPDYPGDTPNHTCCAFNNLIDNDQEATFHQLTPWEAKVSHNPPYDIKQLGTEVRSPDQASITTEQYETLSYWTIAVGKLKGWLGKVPIQEWARGHGEERDKYKAANPQSNLGNRDDFNYPEAERLRQEIQEELIENPELLAIQPQLR